MNNQGYSKVDAVVLQLGINDVIRSFDDYENFEIALDDYQTCLKQMINSIKEYDPDVKIVLQSILPCDTNQDSFTGSYGTLFTVWEFMHRNYLYNLALIDEYRYKESENIYLSWYAASLDAENNQGGDVHPTAEGYKQIGEQTYYFLKAII